MPAGSLTTALAFISANASVTTGVYNIYLGKEKKWKKEDLFNGVMFTDALVHILSVVLISGAIILVGAIVLHPTGQSIKAPAQLAEMMVPIMDNAARYIMGIALLGAGFNRDVSLTSKFVRIGCMLCLVFGAVVCYSYGGSPTQLIFLANLGTSVATPVAGLFITLLIWRKDVNEGYKTPTALRICMTVSYLFVLVMTVSALTKLFS